VTPKELDQAIAVLLTQELGCHRYTGTDPEILRRLPPECCDYFLPQPFVPATFSSDGPPFRFALLESSDSIIDRFWKKIYGSDKAQKDAGTGTKLGVRAYLVLGTNVYAR
jgi:hypothetical protein